MIGSISKIRPCGHHHYYKYAHVESNTSKVAGNTNNRFYFIERDYVKDIYNDNCWGPFSLHNAKTITSCSFEDGRFTKFKARTPNLTNANNMFTNDNGITSPAVEYIDMDYDKLTGCYALFYGFRLKDLPENFNPVTRNFDHLFTGQSATSIGNAHGGVFPFYPVLNEVVKGTFMFNSNNALQLSDEYTFDKVTNAYAMFYRNAVTGLKKFPDNLSFKNVTTIDYLIYGGNKSSLITSFQTKDTMSALKTMDYAFRYASTLTSLYPDYDSFSLPSLTSATGCFDSCILDGKSIIKLSDALPDWSGDTTAHNITIGCHIDNKYNPEVNIALKKLNNTYITPIEEKGEDLEGVFESDKGWKLTVQWNGTYYTGEEYLTDDLKDIILGDNIQLPDGYTRCLYLQSDSNGKQYIDTEYLPTSQSGIYIFAKSLCNTAICMGSGEWWQAWAFQAPLWQATPSSWMNENVTYGSQRLEFGKIGNGKFYEGWTNFLNSKEGKIKVGDTVYSGTLTSNPTPKYTLYMFGNNVNNSLDYRWNGRFYRVKISEGTEIVRDFIPCLDASGKPCMRDVINGVDYYNKGTGDDFTYELAPVVENPYANIELVEGSNYIPDASKWNEEVLQNSNLKIVKIENEKAFIE